MNHRDSKVSVGNDAGKEPVCRGELERLEAQRKKSAPTLTYEMGGADACNFRQRAEMMRAQQEKFVRDRLEQQSGRAANDFGLARVRGKAEHDFEPSR